MAGRQTPHSGRELKRALVFHEAAIVDINAAFCWYEVQRLGLGSLFMDELERRQAQVALSPVSFPKVRGEVRRALLHKFPYSIFFFVRPASIEVIAVLHHSRHPGHLRKRLSPN